MKNLLLSLFVLLFSVSLIAQEESNKKARKLPAVDIKTADGVPFNTSEISNEGNPVIVSFWALWCKPCIKELNTIADEYYDWQEETGVKLIAVSIDDARSSSKVKPFADGNDWDY